MKINALRGAFALVLLLAAAGCKAAAPRLPTAPEEPNPPAPPPSSGHLAPALPPIYV